MGSVPLLLVITLVLTVADFGSSKPTPDYIVQSRKRDQEYLKYFSYKYDDNSNQLKVAVGGHFRLFNIAESTITQIIDRGADWCGFAVYVQRNEDIRFYWNKNEKSRFDKTIEEGDCIERERKKMFIPDDGKNAKEPEKKQKNKWKANLTLGLAIGFGVLSVILLIAVIILCAKACSLPPSMNEYPSPGSPDAYPARRNHRNQRRSRRRSKNEQCG